MTHRRAGCCEFAARHSCRGEVARAQHRRELDEIAAAGESMGESLVSLESVLASTMGAVRRRSMQNHHGTATAPAEQVSSRVVAVGPSSIASCAAKRSIA